MSAVLQASPQTVNQNARGRLRMVRARISPELVLGGIFLIIIVVATLGADWIAPYGPSETIPGMALMEPSRDFLAGTDSIGRDVFSRVIHGGRVSLAVAVPAVALATALGLLVGLPAGYFGGKLDTVVMRVLDMFFAFPAILLAITVISIFGASLSVLSITIGVIYMPRMARIVRAPTMGLVQREYIEAARSIGVSDLRILLRHIVPNISSPIIVEISLALGQVILTETALSFLGLGVPPPRPTWGAMLSESRAFMQMAPWTVLAPGVAIILAVATFLLLGHGLRQLLSPQANT